MFPLVVFLLAWLRLPAQNVDIDYITSADGLSNSSVIKVFQDSDGVMWFGTWDGLNSWNSRNLHIYKSSKDDPGTISSNVVRDIAEDTEGYLWVCTDRGVDRMDRSSGRCKRFFTSDAGSISGEQPYSIFVGGGAVYVFLDGKGIWRFGGESFTKVFDSSHSCRKFRMEGVVPVILDKGDSLFRSYYPVDYDEILSPYIGCNDSFTAGGVVYTATGKGLYADGHPLLEGVPVLSLFPGTQGVLWAGTDMHGVARINPEGPMFSSIRDSFGGSAVRCFMKDAAAQLLVGTKGSGIYLLTRDGVVARQITTADGLISNSVYCFADSPEKIWIGTEGRGLNFIDKRRGEISRLQIPDSLAALAPASVYSILPAGRDTLWIGTSGHGLICATLSGDKMLAARRYDASRLGSNVVYSVIDGGDGSLWIGTRGGGVRRLFLADDRVESVPSEYDVLSLVKTADGIVWAGTSDGLNKIYPDGGLRRYTQKDGLPNNTIHGIVPDDGGALWLSTNRGLAKLDPARGEIFSYFATDGLQDNEFSDGAYYRFRDGHIYFGGIRGITRFDEAIAAGDSFIPSLMQDGFFIDNEPALIEDYLRAGRLSLRHTGGTFSFSFVPLDYINSQRCELQYILEGFNRDWVRLGTSSTVVFSNLPVGHYNLRVKCSSAERKWSEREWVLPIRITPRWWESPLAFILYLAVIAGLIYFIHRLRSERAQARKEKEIHQAKLQFFSDMGYNLSNALTLMSSPAEKLQGGRLTADQKQYLETIESGSDRMHSLVKQFIDALDDIPVPEVSGGQGVYKRNEELEAEQIKADSLLIVEQDAGIRAFVGALMSSRFNIVEAAGGAEALAKAKDSSPALIISAMKLDDMDGLDFLAKLRAEGPLKHIPVIMLSGRDSMERRIAALERGADAYLPKPFNPKHLLALADSLLGRGEVNREYGGSARSAVQQMAQKAVKNEDKALVVRVSDIIIKNIENENLSLDDVAAEAALSKMQLYRKLRVAVGMTPTEFIRHIRLENARKLLKTSHKTVQEIMYACGFSNKTYFYREFKKKYGVTPKQLREGAQAMK